MLGRGVLLSSLPLAAGNGSPYFRRLVVSGFRDFGFHDFAPHDFAHSELCKIMEGKIMEGKIMKTKALASYDQLILATKRGSYYGPVPYRFMTPPAQIGRASCRERV